MTMRERIARAIAERTNGPDSFDRLWASEQRHLLETADAVLNAMREPTGIDEAGRDATGGYPYAPHDVPKLGYMQIAIIWRAMIDAATAGA